MYNCKKILITHVIFITLIAYSSQIAQASTIKHPVYDPKLSEANAKKT